MSDTENTVPATENTDNTEQSRPTQENTSQDETLARLKDYEQKLTQFAELEKQAQAMEKELKTAQSEALRWQSSYKSLQANTTASLQEAARNRRALEEQQRYSDELAQTRSEITALREGLAFIASKVGDEDTAKEYLLRQRETQVKQMEEAARQRATAVQTATQPANTYGYIDPSLRKQYVIDYYFPNSGVDPNDPSIDWGEGAASNEDAWRRFTTSVMQVRDRKSSTSEEPKAQSEAEKLLAQLQKEREDFEKVRATAEDELKTTARKEVEARLRQVGADSGNGLVGSGSASAARIGARLNEIDESKLYQGDSIAARQRAGQAMEDEIRKLRTEYLNSLNQR